MSNEPQDAHLARLHWTNCFVWRKLTAMAQLRIKIDLGKKGLLGPGKAQLLELIDEHGSIRQAAAAMNMSYRRAWLLLKEIESIMGGRVIRAETGGSTGGGATLTELGRTVIARYREIEKRASQSVAGELRRLAQMTGQRGRVGSKRMS